MHKSKFNLLLAILSLVAWGTCKSFAASFEVGPGLTYTNLAGVPWTSLAPGDTVNIHYQSAGYHEVILLSNSGTSNAPITLNGVPDPVTGNLPVLDGNSAISAPTIPWNDVALNTEGVIVISRSASAPYGNIPSWIVIQNLHVQNAAPSHNVTQSDGTSVPFDILAAAIYVEYGQNIVINGCELNGSCNGFFCSSLNNTTNELSANLLIQHSWIHDNGYPANYSGDNINTEAEGVTFQYNLIGPLSTGADGQQIEDHSSGTVLRYNLVIDSPAGTAFSFLQTSGGAGIIDADPQYRASYVYGNVFFNPSNSTAGQMFTYDAGYIEGQPRNGTLYFYNNTVVNQANQAQRYGTTLFDLPTHADSLLWNLHDVVDCRNNIFASLPATTGGAASLVSLDDSDDSTINFGANWISPGAALDTLPYQVTNFYGTITGTNQIIFSKVADPGFVNVAATNFQLVSTSPAIDAAAPQFPLVAASAYNDLSEYVYPTSSTPRVTNGKAPDLGAFEGTSTNSIAPTYTLIVNNGLGGGTFASGTIVPIIATNAPAGEVFANWTGFAVANASAPYTTLIMPGSNVTVSITYSNAPPPIYFILTVTNGLGSGNYTQGMVVSITASNPPSGMAFAGWSGYLVLNAGSATTSLIMPGTNIGVAASYTNAPFVPSYNLTVVNGSGSGSYAAGSTITITASAPTIYQTFAGWTGYSVTDPSALSTTLVMPASATTVTANYQSTGPLPSTLPPPVASHPRLWLTTNDLPKYRQWAVATNAIYAQGFAVVLRQCVSDYQTQFFPGGVANTNYPDLGDVQGYQGLLTEEESFILAFGSLIDPSPANRSLYATYARNLLMYAMNQAVLGHAAGVPFRDPAFAIYNRANGSGENWPLAVDWIYNAIGTNGNPVFSATDKQTIRNVFMIWANDCVNASTTGGDHPEPIGTLNNTQLLPSGSAYRMAANNYYGGHARLMTLMALAIDPADDPPVNAAQSVSVLGNSLRSYLDDAVGAWLYQQYAMFGDPASVILDYGLASDASVGLASGGLPPEGMLYGESSGSIMMGLFGLQTAGYDDPALIGPQASLINAPVWGRFANGIISSLVPAAQVYPGASYMGPVYEVDSYGDVLRLWITPNDMESFSLMALMEQHNGISTHFDTARWFVINAVEGGAANLLNRASNPWSYGVTESVLYFMLLNPNLPPPPDPRPALPLAFVDPHAGRIVDRTAWNPAANQFDFLASWISINHQQGAGGQFEFYRNGEWLTKEVSNYDDNGNGQSTIWHNMLALQNWCSAGTPNVGSYELPFFVNGSEWTLGESVGDPVTLTSSSPDYTFANADLTPLFNRPSIWSPENACLDIQEATRFVIWLKPDHIVVYDRATSTHAGFKQFNLNLVATPVISSNTVSETTPNGQQLFVSTLLPANPSIQYVPLGNTLTTVAQLEPSAGRVVVQATNQPINQRFLHVLQGADAGAKPDAVTLVRSAAGSSFEGAAVRGEVVLFPVNALSNNFTSLNYTAPAGITNHFIAGLGLNTSYSVHFVANAGQQQVTITPGSEFTTDSAGLLAFNNSGQVLSGTPRLISVTPGHGTALVIGTGQANQLYSILGSTNLTTTNWVHLGAATTDLSGKLQFTDPSTTNIPTRFYRLSVP